MTENYKMLKKQISFSALYKVLIIFFNFALTSLLIRYLGPENFGIYIALTSLMSWMFLFDLGLAKGMRNYVAIHINKNEVNEARFYISSTYFGVFVFSFLSLIFVFLILNNSDLVGFFNAEIEGDILKNSLFILMLGFFIRFPLSTVDQLNFAIHKSENVTLNSFLISLLNCSLLLFIMYFFKGGGIGYAILVFSISISLPYLYSSFLFFARRPDLRPSLNYISKNRLYETLNKGFKILFIQIGFLLFVGLDRLILLKFGSAIDVTKYEITYKIMSIIIFPVSILTAPLWSSFTTAFEVKDITWIRWVFNKFYKIILLMGLTSLVLVLAFDKVTYLWLGYSVGVSLTLKLAVAFLILSIIWGSFHSDLLLGTSHFRFVLYISLAGCIFKVILLSYYFYEIASILTPEFLVFSSIAAYSIFNLSSPFYARCLLKSES